MKTRAIALLFCCLLAGWRGEAAVVLKNPIYGYDDYKDIMWQVIGEEPCLRTLIERRDVERAELIFLMHYHLNQFPLKYFCARDGTDPVLAKEEIELFFDAHTHYKRAEKHFDNRWGIGIDLLEDKGNIVISDVGEGSAAFRGGLQRYDKVLLIDRAPVRNIIQAARLIRGKLGSRVRLTLQRNNRIFQKIIAREKKKYANVSAIFMPNRQIGYLKISEFTHHGETVRDVHRLLEMFREARARGIILDLRGNVGGSVFAARLILGYFFGAKIAYLETNPSREEFMLPVSTLKSDSADDWLVQVPMLVLVDRYSYSAAEIVASCLVYYHRAIVAGERTGGKGTIQYSITLHNGKTLVMTMGKWDMINGKTVEGIGMAPNVSFKDLQSIAPLSDNGDVPHFYTQDKDFMSAVSFFEKHLNQ